MEEQSRDLPQLHLLPSSASDAATSQSQISKATTDNPSKQCSLIFSSIQATDNELNPNKRMHLILPFDWKDGNEQFAASTGHNCHRGAATSLALWEAHSVTSAGAKWSSCCEHKCWQVGQYVGRILAFPVGSITAHKVYVYFTICYIL